MDQIIKNTDSLESMANNTISTTLTVLTGMIFSYDDNWLNKNIFDYYLNIQNISDISFSDLINQSILIIREKKSEITNLKESLREYESIEPVEKIAYYKTNLEKIEIFHDLLEKYVLIEARKIKGFENENIWNIDKLISEIEELEEIIYGKKLSERPKYAHMALDRIKQCYKESDAELTYKQRHFLDDVLTKIQDSIWWQYTVAWKNQETQESKMDLIDPLASKEDINNGILEREISRNEYVKIFRLALDILWMQDIKVSIRSVANFSVSYDSINIPDNKEYEFLSIWMIIELISHEIERHVVGNKNNTRLIGTIKSLSYLGQEEWFAHVLQHLSIGHDFNNIPINRYLPRMLAGEILNGDDFRDFLSIMNKLDWENLNVDNFIERAKRGKDLHLPGVNPKEKMYGIWALEIIDRVREWENPLWFFLAKNWKDEQEKISKLVWKTDEQELTPELLKKKEIMLPLMLWELIRYKLVSWEETNKGMLWWFIKHFHDRYGDMFKQFWIDYKSFIKHYIWEEKKGNVKKVEEILDIFEKTLK